MEYAKKQLGIYIVLVIVGIGAVAFALFGNVGDDFKTGIISGSIGGFLLTGIVGGIYSIHLLKNPDKARRMEINETEERSQFIRMRTHSSVFRISIYLESVVTIITGFTGYKEISVAFAGLVLIQSALYVGFAINYGKKY